MSGWCSVEYNMIVSCLIAGQMAGKFVEGSDLRSASARQLFPNSVPQLVARVRSHLVQHPDTIGVGGGRRINIEDLQMLGAGDRDRKIAQGHIRGSHRDWMPDRC